MSTNTLSPAQPSLVKYLIGGGLAGVIAAVINNIYYFAYTGLTGNSVAVINPISVTMASILPIVVGSLGYYIAARLFGARATLIFMVGSLVLAVLSLGGVFLGQLPDGSAPPAWFPVLTLPMHLIAGLVCAFGVPRLVNR
jgi:uncharacterized membrane protein